jgi:hypothetical protein
MVARGRVEHRLKHPPEHRRHHDQDDGKRHLDDDEQIGDAVAAAAKGESPRTPGQQGHDIGPANPPCGEQASQQRSHQHRGQGSDQRVDVDHDHPRQGRIEHRERSPQGHRADENEWQPGEAGGPGDHQSLDEDLPRELPRRRTEAQGDREIAPTPDRARDQQRGRVGARDEEHEQRRSQQPDEGRRRPADTGIGEGHGDAAVGRRRAREPVVQILERLGPNEPEERVDAVGASNLTRQPDVRASRGEPEAIRHDAGDLVEPIIDVEHPADNVRRRGTATVPEVGTQDRRGAKGKIVAPPDSSDLRRDARHSKELRVDTEDRDGVCGTRTAVDVNAPAVGLDHGHLGPAVQEVSKTNGFVSGRRATPHRHGRIGDVESGNALDVRYGRQIVGDDAEGGVQRHGRSNADAHDEQSRHDRSGWRTEDARTGPEVAGDAARQSSQLYFHEPANS